MSEDRVYAGQMNSRVEFFEDGGAKNSSGEYVETKVSMGQRMVKRIDAIGTENADGQILGLSVCRYQMRYDPDIAIKASTLTVRDFDGDWEVVGPMSLIDGRRRYMEIRCRKRGEDITP